MKVKNYAGLKKTLIVMLLFLFSFPAAGTLQAAGEFTLTASEEIDVSGEQVVITVTAENAAGTEGGQFVLNFDPDLLRPVAVDPGELVTEAASALDMANLEYADGQLMFMWVTAVADTADQGEVCFITFDLINEGESMLEFEDIIIAPEEVEDVTAVSGRVSIADARAEPPENEVEEVVNVDDNEEAVVETENEGAGYFWLLGLIFLAILAAAGFVFFKRSKKPRPKHLKR